MSRSSSFLPSGSIQQDHATFPFQLHDLLDDATSKGFDWIVSWLAEGDAFKVYWHKQFEDEIMPVYFKQTKYKSFQRQLNLYNFVRQKDGLKKVM